MSSQRSPYQTGSGLGINSIIAYINANPNSILPALNLLYPKTVQFYSLMSPPVTHFSVTGYTSIKDASGCVQNNMYKAKLNGTYAITMKCDPNTINVPIYVLISNQGVQPKDAFNFHGNELTGPNTTFVDLNKDDTLDFKYDGGHNVTDIVINIAFIHT